MRNRYIRVSSHYLSRSNPGGYGGMILVILTAANTSDLLWTYTENDRLAGVALRVSGVAWVQPQT